MSQKILPEVFDIDCVSIGKYSDFWSSYSLISSRNMYTMYFMVIGDLSPGLNILTTCHEFSAKLPNLATLNLSFVQNKWPKQILKFEVCWRFTCNETKCILIEIVEWNQQIFTTNYLKLWNGKYIYIFMWLRVFIFCWLYKAGGTFSIRFRLKISRQIVGQ